ERRLRRRDAAPSRRPLAGGPRGHGRPALPRAPAGAPRVAGAVRPAGAMTPARRRGDWGLLFVLSATAGAGGGCVFSPPGGLFTAHITGNIVVLAAHYLTGSSGELGKLLSVPVFALVLGTVALLCGAIQRTGRRSRYVSLMLQAALLVGCLALALAWGPF